MAVATNGCRRPVAGLAKGTVLRVHVLRNAVVRGVVSAMVLSRSNPQVPPDGSGGIVKCGSGGYLTSGDECCTRRLTSNLWAAAGGDVMPSYRMPGLPEDDRSPPAYSPGWRRRPASRGVPRRDGRPQGGTTAHGVTSLTSAPPARTAVTAPRAVRPDLPTSLPGGSPAPVTLPVRSAGSGSIPPVRRGVAHLPRIKPPCPRGT
ncbi:hypothetical protein GCM10010431_30290 [Streptomyces kunmingensis]